MARLIRPLRRTFLTPPKTLFPQLQQHPISMLNRNELAQTIITRTYKSKMRKSAFQENTLRLLRNEIQYEFDHNPPRQPVAKFNSFSINDQPGEQWISLKRKFAENEEIKVEATMFDGAIPSSKPNDVTNNNMQLHVTLIVSISKGDGDTLEIMCSAWPDSIEITKLFTSRRDKMPAQAYVGPDFRELDDELQEALYEFMEARGINDEMATFLHEYMKNKESSECIRWMGKIKKYMEEK